MGTVVPSILFVISNTNILQTKLSLFVLWPKSIRLNILGKKKKKHKDLCKYKIMSRKWYRYVYYKAK